MSRVLAMSSGSGVVTGSAGRKTEVNRTFFEVAFFDPGVLS